MIARTGFALLIALGAIASARADDVRIVYYDISGHTIRDLVEQMQTKGPFDKSSGGRSAAYTEWRVSWNFRYESTPRSCKLTELSASAEGTMTLPHWVDGGTAPASRMKEWRHFVAALRVHENGHYAHGVQAAEEVRALAGSIQPAADCDDLTRQVTNRAEAILEKYRAVDAKYDRDTKHGQAQGAVLVIQN